MTISVLIGPAPAAALCGFLHHPSGDHHGCMGASEDAPKGHRFPVQALLLQSELPGGKGSASPGRQH